MNESFWGKSAFINLHECNDKINNPKEIKKFVKLLCEEIGMKRVGKLHLKKFGDGTLEGYSFMQFIETSSITAHFEDKMGNSFRAFIDIFSCKEFDDKKAAEFCREFFNAEISEMKTFIRR